MFKVLQVAKIHVLDQFNVHSSAVIGCNICL